MYLFPQTSLGLLTFYRFILPLLPVISFGRNRDPFHGSELKLFLLFLSKARKFPKFHYLLCSSLDKVSPLCTFWEDAEKFVQLCKSAWQYLLKLHICRAPDPGIP